MLSAGTQLIFHYHLDFCESRLNCEDSQQFADPSQARHHDEFLMLSQNIQLLFYYHQDCSSLRPNLISNPSNPTL